MADPKLTLGQIIEAVRSGQRPSYEDLRYAICAIVALCVFDSQALQRLAEAEKDGKHAFMAASAEWQWNEHFERRKRALNKVPKEYVGWANDPENPEFLERRGQAVRLFEKLMRRRATP